jgi:hypothetical protein
MHVPAGDGVRKKNHIPLAKSKNKFKKKDAVDHAVARNSGKLGFDFDHPCRQELMTI